MHGVREVDCDEIVEDSNDSKVQLLVSKASWETFSCVTSFTWNMDVFAQTHPDVIFLTV